MTRGAGLARWREIAALALAVPAAWAAPRLLGLGPADPLHGTVAVLPIVAAGLFAVESAAVRHGARRPRATALAARFVALLAWLVLAALRSRLDLPLAPALAAGFFALLAAHLVDLLPRLRPLLGDEVPARPPAAFFWLPLLAYLAILPWSTSQRPPDGDEPYYLLVTHSLAYDHDADLANNYARGDSLRFLPRRLEPQPGDPVGAHGELFSRHNVLLPLALALPYRIAGARGAFVAMAALAALLAWLTLRLMRHGFATRPGGALLAWALFAFMPPLLLYSHQVWVEVPAALFIALAVDALPALPTSRRARAIFWAMVVLLPLLKLRFAGFAGLLVALAWWRGGRRARTAAAATGLLVALFAGILAFNHARFGSALKSYGLEQLLPESGATVVLARTVGLFFDAPFGLVATAPLWLLLVPALVLHGRRGGRFAAELAFLVVPYVVLVAFRREWYGGWSPPFRYGIPVLPLLTLPLAALLDDRRRSGARVLATALAALSAGLALLWLALPGWTYNFADGSSYALSSLAGELRLDLARLFPSAIRLRAATWWWPAAAALVALVAWRWPRRPRTAALAVGTAIAIALPAFVVLAAAHLPTRLVEVEDAQVSKVGGGLYPERWTFDRPRFRGGWALDTSTRVEAPVVPAGRHVGLGVWCEAMTAASPGGTAPTLVLAAGDTALGGATLAPGTDWQRVEVPPVDWPAGAPLVLSLAPGSPSVIVDRVELDWR